MKASSLKDFYVREKKVSCRFMATNSERAQIIKNSAVINVTISEFARFIIRAAETEIIDSTSIVQLAHARVDGRSLRSSKVLQNRPQNSVVSQHAKKLFVSFCLTEHQKVWVCNQAERGGVSFSAWLRALLTMPIELVEDDALADFEVLRVRELKNEVIAMQRELARIGANCNQIAHSMNVCKNRNWLPADHAEPIFGGANDSLKKIKASLSNLDVSLDGTLATLVGIDERLLPVPIAIASKEAVK